MLCFSFYRGFPDDILSVNNAAAQELAKRTMTTLYNERPACLDQAHRALDEAVANAYGVGGESLRG